ncbi:MAG TPA: chromosome segregation ATPase, partial [Arthrobacter sp.]
MRTSPSKSPLSRRLAAAVVLPGMLTTSLVLVQPAMATTGTATGICNGVVNQLAHRGAVQENLLKAAAKKNADAIAARQAEKAALQAQADDLNVQKAA